MSGESRSTITALIERWAVTTPDAVALLSSDGGTVTYRALAGKCASIAARLAAHGVATGRAVAVLLPNGLDMAVTFLGVAGATVCAPLNPALTESELRFFLADIDAAAVVVEDGSEGPGVVVARERSIPVLRVSTLLECGSPVASSTVAPRRADDVALVLHTSGTTSRPKQVALTHANLIASAGNVAATLLLGPRIAAST